MYYTASPWPLLLGRNLGAQWNASSRTQWAHPALAPQKRRSHPGQHVDIHARKEQRYQATRAKRQPRWSYGPSTDHNVYNNANNTVLKLDLPHTVTQACRRCCSGLLPVNIAQCRPIQRAWLQRYGWHSVNQIAVPRHPVRAAIRTNYTAHRVSSARSRASPRDPCVNINPMPSFHTACYRRDSPRPKDVAQQ